MPEQVYSLLDMGAAPTLSKTSLRAKAKPPVRFVKVGPNANHPLTVEIRKIKEHLQLTTKQLVKELNSFEKEFRKKEMKRKGDDGSPAILPMKTVLMSAYLQGIVVGEHFMRSVYERLQALQAHFEYRLLHFPITMSMREIMDGWFAELNIDKDSTSVSPYRAMAKAIAPFYKRPVLCGDSGTFTLGKLKDGFQIYTIEKADGERNSYYLDPNEPILLKSGSQVEIRDLIQYAVLMSVQLDDGEYKITQEPSIDHTTFYRWYQTNRRPRSIKTLELVNDAVSAVKASTAKGKGKGT